MFSDDLEGGEGGGGRVAGLDPRGGAGGGSLKTNHSTVMYGSQRQGRIGMIFLKEQPPAPPPPGVHTRNPPSPLPPFQVA